MAISLRPTDRWGAMRSSRCGPTDGTVIASAPLPADHSETSQRARLERSLVASSDGPAWTEKNHLASRP